MRVPPLHDKSNGRSKATKWMDVEGRDGDQGLYSGLYLTGRARKR